MNYTVHYECKTENGIFDAEIDIECEKKPAATDDNVNDAALRDSVKFHKIGQGSIRITAITEKSKVK